MPALGTKLSESAKSAISSSRRKFSEDFFIKKYQEYKSELKKRPQTLPTVSGFCLFCGVFSRDLSALSARYPILEDIIEEIKTLQEEYCLQRGITNQVNPSFSMFLLKTKHNYRESPVSLTQNNYMNISPHVLREALALLHEESKTKKKKEEENQEE